MRSFATYLIVALLALSLLFALAAGAVYMRFTHAGPLHESTIVYLPKGTGFQAIVEQLEQSGVIADRFSFAIPVILSGKYKHFKPGEYEFPAGITPKTVMQMMADGKVLIHKITIAEGVTVRQVIEKINAEPLLTGEIDSIPPEGSLLPETYHFVRGDSRSSILRRMQQGMQSLLDELWSKRKPGLPYETPEAAVTLASIVEKETRLPEERTHIAAVYVNRLRLGMKLQADPTTIYAIELESGAPIGRALVKSDLERNLPHNTYAVVGLPPTPIGNPGRASIEAALNPSNSEDIFFVATGNGGHNFAKTYAEHQANVLKLRAQVSANANK